VHGSPTIDGFLKVGKRWSETIEAALKKIGKDFDSFENVLDFGCGCGRTLIWIANRRRSSQLYGTDIDAQAISWCRDNLDFAEFSVSNPRPPLEYPSEAFDFIYAISVFTRLDEYYQFRWLSELKRTTRPKGIVILTVHGHHFWKDLPHEDVIDLRNGGFKFISANAMKGISPEWYQNAYHTEGFVLDQYSKYFGILDCIPEGRDTRQGVVVLRKPQ
jgi:SAM-dependent methyltransferase